MLKRLSPADWPGNVFDLLHWEKYPQNPLVTTDARWYDADLNHGTIRPGATLGISRA